MHQLIHPRLPIDGGADAVGVELDVEEDPGSFFVDDLLHPQPDLVAAAEVEFLRDENGEVDGLTLFQNGEHHATRVADEAGDEDDAGWAPSAAELESYAGRASDAGDAASLRRYLKSIRSGLRRGARRRR